MRAFFWSSLYSTFKGIKAWALKRKFQAPRLAIDLSDWLASYCLHRGHVSLRQSKLMVRVLETWSQVNVCFTSISYIHPRFIHLCQSQSTLLRLLCILLRLFQVRLLGTYSPHCFSDAFGRNCASLCVFVPQRKCHPESIQSVCKNICSSISLKTRAFRSAFLAERNLRRPHSN